VTDGAAFDHLIHWVDDLESATAGYDALGLTTHAAVTLPGFRNAAWGIDDERYVELAVVDDWDAVTRSKYARGIELLTPAIDRLGGPGLLTFGVDVPDARATAEELRAVGRDVVVDEVWFEDRNGGFVEVYVRDAPSYFPFFITYQPPRVELARMRAEHRAEQGLTRPPDAPDLVALLVRSPAPQDEARALGELIGCPVDGAVVDLPGAQVRFEPGGPAGLYGIVVRGLTSPDEASIAGITVLPG